MKLIQLAVLALCSQAAFAQNAERHFLSASRGANSLEITTNDGKYVIKPYSAAVVETTFIPNGERPDPSSHAVVLAPAAMPTTLRDEGGALEYATPGLTVRVEKKPFRIAYLYKGQPLVAEKRGYRRAKSSRTICERGEWTRHAFSRSRTSGGGRSPAFPSATCSTSVCQGKAGTGFPEKTNENKRL